MAEQDHYDVVIIGSGAGGGTLAWKLAPTGLRILLLERGGYLPRERDLWDTDAVFLHGKYVTSERWVDGDGHHFTPEQNYYVGGNTKFYGAALFRLRPEDFGEIQHHGGLSPAWPIGYDEMEPWYAAAEELYWVHGQAGEDPTDGPRSSPYPYPAVKHEPRIQQLHEDLEKAGLHPSHLPIGVMLDQEDDGSATRTSTCIRCDRVDGFACVLGGKADAETAAVAPALAHPNLHLVTGAYVERLETDEGGHHVSAVVARLGDGTTHRFSGDVVVVSCGALNSTLLLLRSANADHPNGLANGSDQVGRNYMRHNNLALMALSREPNPTTFQKTLAMNSWYLKGEDWDYPWGGIQMLGKADGEQLKGKAPHFLAWGAKRMPRSMMQDIAHHSVDFWLSSEDLPLPENRVTIERDGTVRLTLGDENNTEGLKRMRRKLDSMLGDLGMHEETHHRSVYLYEGMDIAATAHQAGTVRFGADPASSVLDPLCKAHEVDNLYVVDSSFFASIGAVNPTLTIIANALRVGDHLASRLARAAVVTGAEGAGSARLSAQALLAQGLPPAAGLWRTAEGGRLLARDEEGVPWDLWGPYVSHRAWGTVREDYSTDGDAWAYFPHDHARSRTYRWNEDGLLGICDRHQHLCFALALWNGQDPILKERPFGLTGAEGNHGEDVKEYWFYLDNTPSHAYMKALYKYPHAAFPYEDLIATNGARSKDEPEYEIVDTGVFDEGRYFDVQVEYAKADVDDLVIRITVANRGPEPASIHVLPTLWFRNTWSWGRGDEKPGMAFVPAPATDGAGACSGAIVARHAALGAYEPAFHGADEVLFTENETNAERLFGTPSASPYVKDAFHAHVVEGRDGAVNPQHQGTKAAPRFRLDVAAGAEAVIDLRLRRAGADGGAAGGLTAHEVLDVRRSEADELYQAVLPASLTDDARLARQALAGLLWSKQYYHYVVKEWLEGDPSGPPVDPHRGEIRNGGWTHLHNADVISMPDTWEFPWYASWDLAFHCATFGLLDPAFAKQQLVLMLREWYMDRRGRVPAYEWNFDDVNPPVLPLAAASLFLRGPNGAAQPDFAFLERAFHKLLLNFTWWVNREDAEGNDIFEGGFLGLDNIGPFDRSKGVPAGYHLGQADGTAWMAVFAQVMQFAALILATHDPVYEDVAVKFFEHSLDIAHALNGAGGDGTGLWDEDDGFYYDVLQAPDGTQEPVRARTVVGLVPLFGSFTVPLPAVEAFPTYLARRDWYLAHRPDLAAAVFPLEEISQNGRVLRSVVTPERFDRLVRWMLDEEEFLSPYGIRAVSRWHAEHPYVFDLAGVEHRLDYEPGESTTNLFGGNSNWRGPIWMPVNYLLIRAVDAWASFYGDTKQVECPVGSGRTMTLGAVATDLVRRVTSIFLRGEDGRRPVWGDVDLFQRDPHWRDLVPFHEYFHGDTGRGCGAAHQTGWTALVALLLVEFADRLAASEPGAPR